MERASQRHILIDAWNIAHAWADVKRFWRQGPAAVAAVLEARLRVLQDRGGWAVTLVFDGKRPGDGAVPVSANDGIDVVYTENGISADAFIERFVASCPIPSTILVATGDRALANAVFAMGADVLSPSALREEVQRRGKSTFRGLSATASLTQNPFRDLK